MGYGATVELLGSKFRQILVSLFKPKVMKITLCIILLTTILLSCDDEPNIQLPTRGNYFPTSRGSHWTYENTYTCDPPNESLICTSTSESRAEGEELPWDQSYEPFTSATSGFQFVKIIGHEYFSYAYYVPEYKFLDNALPVGGKWTNPMASDNYKEEFEILEINASKDVHGVTYHDVIVVRSKHMWRMNTNDAFEPITETTRWFARDIGEIYSKRIVYDGVSRIFENSLTAYSIIPN